MVFVGQQHQEVLRAIQQRWEGILAGDEAGPRLITLVGHQGVGKSRIIKEFYRHIAARQSPPSYWPAEILAEGRRRSRDPMPERKVLGPVAATWPANALPDFLWWEFEGDVSSSGSASPALLAGEARLKKHEPALWEAYLRRSGLWKRLADGARRTFRQLAADQSVELLSRMLGELGIVIPGMGFAIQRLTDLARYKKQRQQELHDFQNEVRLDDGTADLGIDLAMRVLGQCEAVPVVVAIEDAHWADPSLCGLLRVMATSRSKVLILASAWREGMNVAAPDHHFAVLEEELRRAGFAAGFVVDPPEAAESQRLLEDYATTQDWQVPRDVIEALVSRFQTPLGIVLAMTSEFMAAFVADGCPREELDEMPETLADLYQRRWEELDPDVRDALILAALLSPAGTTSGACADGRVSLDLILRSLTSLEGVLPATFRLPNESQLQSAYGSAVNDVAWLMEVAQATEQFREPELAKIAMDRARSRGVRKAHTSRVRSVYLDVLRRVLEAHDAPGVSRALAAAHYLTLDSILDDDEVPDDRYLGLAAMLSAAGYASAYQFRDAIDVLRSVKDRVASSTRVDVLRQLANLCSEARLWEEAAQYYRELLGLQAADLTPFDPTTADLLAELARCDLELHKYEQVEAMLSPVAETLPDGLDEVTIKLRRRHANAIRGDRKRLNEAQTLLESLLAEITSARSDEVMWDIEEADTRMALAVAHKRAGDNKAALHQVDIVIPLRRRAFGENGQKTLTALGEKALLLKETAGREQEGMALQREVLQRRLAAYGGPRHPLVLKSRHSVAFSAIQADPVGAAQDLRELLRDKREVLGPHHLSTIATLAALARALGESGELTESLALYDEAVHLKSKYGSTTGDALLTRRKRLRILRRADCAAALVEARRLVSEYGAERGPDSVGALRARFEEAETVSICQDAAAGLELHRAVLEDRRRVLPEGHIDIAESEEAVRRLEG